MGLWIMGSSWVTPDTYCCGFTYHQAVLRSSLYPWGKLDNLCFPWPHAHPTTLVFHCVPHVQMEKCDVPWWGECTWRNRHSHIWLVGGSMGTSALGGQLNFICKDLNVYSLLSNSVTSRNVYYKVHMWTGISILLLCVMTKHCQHLLPLVEGGLDKSWFSHTVEYYAAVKHYVAKMCQYRIFLHHPPPSPHTHMHMLSLIYLYMIISSLEICTSNW